MRCCGRECLCLVSHGPWHRGIRTRKSWFLLHNGAPPAPPARPGQPGQHENKIRWIFSPQWDYTSSSRPGPGHRKRTFIYYFVLSCLNDHISLELNFETIGVLLVSLHNTQRRFSHFCTGYVKPAVSVTDSHWMLWLISWEKLADDDVVSCLNVYHGGITGPSIAPGNHWLLHLLILHNQRFSQGLIWFRIQPTVFPICNKGHWNCGFISFHF